MRNPVENISLLQKQINDLQLENQILKNILDRSGISYTHEIAHISEPERAEEYDPDQGARIIHPRQITEEMANLFYARFWGRQDVYAKRSEKKGTGEAGYYTQCHNRWENICPKMRHEKMNCKDCPHQAYKQLTIKDILAHLQGRSYNGSDVIGVYPLLKNGTCRFLVFDFDNHEKGAEKKDFANTNEAWLEEVEAMRTICGLNGIDPLVERSRSGRGAHLWMFFDKPLPAALARRFGFTLLEKGAEQVNLKSFKYYDRMLPAQDTLPEGGLGNLIALPLQGKALQKGNSAFVDSNWNVYPNQWEVLWSKPRLSARFIETKIKEWAAPNITEATDDAERAGEREQLRQTAPGETLALVATGSLIGEGFDFPRLDTLIMATPVSFRSVVEQYAGRLNRNYDGKKDVIVFDYVDSHIPMFERMYGKRLKAYKQIGYEICSGLAGEKQEANAIFDGDDYKEVFMRDMLEAEQRIVISSSTISAKRIYEMINMLKEKQALGTEVTIVTWNPDDYGFGDAAFWMQLHEDMRQAGFFIKTVEESCENFAVIDQEIIWYGNIHLLGKEKAEDNIMRVKDKNIAAELMELTFKS